MSDAILGPGAGERHAVGGAEFVIKATAESTGGHLFLQEATVGPGSPTPPPHHHDAMTDMFYVLEGVLTVRVGDTTQEAGPGTFVCAPPGTIHTFWNTSDAPVRLLNFSTPGGWETYMRELAEGLASGRPPGEIFAGLVERHDLVIDG